MIADVYFKRTIAVVEIVQIQASLRKNSAGTRKNNLDVSLGNSLRARYTIV